MFNFFKYQEAHENSIVRFRGKQINLRKSKEYMSIDIKYLEKIKK